MRGSSPELKLQKVSSKSEHKSTVPANQTEAARTIRLALLDMATFRSAQQLHQRSISIRPTSSFVVVPPGP
eukprot:2533382-Amphidinium_carterae.1